ncbi:MAG: GFA family protein [Alphaproteobacteria bacterium]|nr:GFA family protein [Alphaproteobacteria bacterium]
MAATPRSKTRAATAHTGGCLCGAVRFRTTGPLGPVSHCHCTMCRKASGAPVVTFTRVGMSEFAFTKGKPKEYRSSKGGRRGFCAKCGSQLCFMYDAKPDSIGLNVGCFDEPERLKPVRHIYSETMIPWLHMDDGLPRLRNE